MSLDLRRREKGRLDVSSTAKVLSNCLGKSRKRKNLRVSRILTSVTHSKDVP